MENSKIHNGRISDEEFLVHLPKSYKPKARKLLSHINQSKGIIQWSNNDELIFEGHIVKNSGRHQLIHFLAVRKGTSVPTGADEFASLLYQTRIPVTSTGDFFKKKFPKYQRINIKKYKWWKK